MATVRDEARAAIIALLQSEKASLYDSSLYDGLSAVRDDEELAELASEAIDAKRQMISDRDDLLREIASVRRTFDDAEAYLSGGSGRFNSLGLLQSQGSSIDRLAALFTRDVEVAIAAECRFRKASARKGQS